MSRDKHREVQTLTVAELKNLLRKRSRLDPGKELEIICDDVDVIPYRDLFEAYFWISGVKEWIWKDSAGNISGPQNLGRIVIDLISDVLTWGPQVCCQRIRVYLAAKRKNKIMLDEKLSPILFLRSDHWFNLKSGGSVGHLRGVIEGLRSLGYPTIVVSTDALVDIPRDDHFFIVKPNGAWGRNLPEIPHILYTERLFQEISQHWFEWNPSLVYQRYSMGNYTGVLLKGKYNVPYICEYNGSFTWMAEHWDSRMLVHHALIHDIEMLNLESADAVIVVSQALKDELVQRGIEPGKILVNPNGVDPQRYSPEVDGSGIRRSYDLTDKIVIGFIGTFGSWHGAEKLAEAFGLLINENPTFKNKVRLLMMGDGVNLPKTKRILEELHGKEYSIFTGMIPQDAGPAHLAACDILVAPQIPNPDGSAFFGSPTKLFEYMAMGKGIIASRLEQMSEILEDGRTALLVTPGDVDDLLQGMKTLIEDEALRTKLGMAARMEVVDHYTWLAHTCRIVKFIEESKGA